MISVAIEHVFGTSEQAKCNLNNNNFSWILVAIKKQNLTDVRFSKDGEPIPGKRNSSWTLKSPKS